MLTLGIVDANEKASKRYAGIVSSVVGGWLRWEVTRAGVTLVEPRNADVVLLVFAGALDWLAECTAGLKRAGIEPNARKRQGRPYVITGGPCDAIPFTALSVSDALAIGEAYTLVRTILDMLKDGACVDDLVRWFVAYDHAIERSQIDALERDKSAPWLLTTKAPKLARPDSYVDWDVPPIRSDDKVVRVVGEKGCHAKCLFCATTYRQTHRQNSNEFKVRQTLESVKSAGERVQLISNDPMALPYFRRITTRLDSQSFTIAEVSDDENRRALIANGISIARFGVEGLSERIRKAFAKPVSNDKLLEVITELHANKINSHMFFIVGAPYECEADWDEFRDFYYRLARTVRTGICRVKFTTFVNTPPAPLSRFVHGETYAQRMADLSRWIGGNSASRHVVYVRGRGYASYVRNVAEQLAVPNDVVQGMLASRDTFDLLPSLDDAHRAIWEIIDWPISTSKRWKISETYRRRMTGQTPVLEGGR